MGGIAKIFKPITNLLGLSAPKLPEPAPLKQPTVDPRNQQKGLDPNEALGNAKARERATRLATKGGGRSFRIDLEGSAATGTGLSIGGK